jgi:Co/Zn/Cd efflux system component
MVTRLKFNATKQHKQKQALIISMATNFSIFVPEVIFAIIANSLGMLADSIDMFIDSITYLIAYIAIGKAKDFQNKSSRWMGILQTMLATVILNTVI